MSDATRAARDLDLAIALRASGRIDEAIEHYISAACGFRDAGRLQNAIAVCQSLLEIAPEDPVGRSLLDSLAPARTSSISDGGATPIPPAVPYHVADPTTRLRKKITDPELANSALANSALLAAMDSESLDTPYDVAAELETRKRPLIEEAELLALSLPPPSDPDELPTPIPYDGGGVLRDLLRDHDTDDDLRATAPREAVSLDVTNPNLEVTSVTDRMLSGALLAGIPAPHRATVLARFTRKKVPSGTRVLGQGEQDHPLVVLGSGEMVVRVEREDGRLMTLFEVYPGDHVGEGSLLGRRASPIHVFSLVECELLLLFPHDLYEIAGAFPALWARLKDVAEKRAKEHSALRSP
jgi:hypothetical protein